VLKVILTEEGYMERENNMFNPYYYLKDHLGNNRIVMNSSGTVVQATNHYPSGTLIAEYPRRTDQGVQPYKFGGKELDRTHGLDFYDFEARAFDPTLMRFTTIDPLAEKYYSISPYAYCGNNPVNRIDPTGMDWVEDEEGNAIWKEEYTKDNVPKGYKYIGTEYMGISVVKYYKTKYMDKHRLGVTIDLGYKGENGDYQWVQTIMTNNPRYEEYDTKGFPYVDPTIADDDLPYYYQEGNTSFLNKDGYDATFFDRPSRPGGEDTFWVAELSLVKKTGKAKEGETTPFHYDPIVTLRYGFNAVTNPQTPLTLTVLKNPSTYHIKSINQKVPYPTLRTK
jgi:RHS repeat-associated protein